jgi:hypothetical protein
LQRGPIVDVAEELPIVSREHNRRLRCLERVGEFVDERE